MKICKKLWLEGVSFLFCLALLFRVAYKSKLTGAEGHGNWNTDKELIKAWVLKGNRNFPDIHHWLEAQETIKGENL